MIIAGDRGKRLHCINAKDGAEKWSFRSKGKIDSSPVITGNNAVFGCDDGNIYAVSLNDGSQIWNYECGKEVQSSPCIAGGRLLMGADDGMIYCFSTSP